MVRTLSLVLVATYDPEEFCLEHEYTCNRCVEKWLNSKECLWYKRVLKYEDGKIKVYKIVRRGRRNGSSKEDN